MFLCNGKCKCQRTFKFHNAFFHFVSLLLLLIPCISFQLINLSDETRAWKEEVVKSCRIVFLHHHHHHHHLGTKGRCSHLYRMSNTILLMTTNRTTTFIPASVSDSYIISKLSSHEVNEEMLRGCFFFYSLTGSVIDSADGRTFHNKQQSHCTAN